MHTKFGMVQGVMAEWPIKNLAVFFVVIESIPLVRLLGASTRGGGKSYKGQMLSAGCSE